MNPYYPADHKPGPSLHADGIYSVVSFNPYLLSHVALNSMRNTQSISASKNSIKQLPISDSQCELAKNRYHELVGHTPVSEIPEISDYFGVKRLLIKDEGCNPHGTHKDRKSYYAVHRARNLRNPPGALCLITAGNAGLSLASFAATYKLPVIAIIDALAPSIQHKLERACEQVLRVDLQAKRWSSRELRLIAGADQGRRVMDITNLAIPYRDIALEIAPFNPDVIVLPVGGGELFLGLMTELRALGLQTRLIGVTVRKSETMADKLYAKWTPYRGLIQQLTNGTSRHRLYYLDDETTLNDTLQITRKYLRCEPSSATAFDILRQLSFKPDEKVMVLNTGAFAEHIALDNCSLVG